MIVFERLSNRIIPGAMLLALLVYACSAQAHSSLLALEQKDHSYTAVFVASADVPEIYSGYAITYVIGLFDANHSDVPFDLAYVEFSAKEGGVIVFSGFVPGATGLIASTTFNIAMPSAGAHEAEVTFMRKEQSASGVRELAKAKFNFNVIENPGDSPPVWKSVYPTVAIAIVIGLLLGSFGTRVYRIIFNKYAPAQRSA